jgi:hypothetical protein
MGQTNEFKVADRETWKGTFSKMLPQDSPAWNDIVKMCAHWHIKGDCYDYCSRAISHITKENNPNNKKKVYLTFMASCREECKKNKKLA